MQSKPSTLASQLFLMLLTFSLLLPVVVRAAEAPPIGLSQQKDMTGLKVGGIEVHPYLNLRETYSDNVFLTPGNRKDDFITTILPGLQLQLPFRRNTLALGANGTISRYARFHSEDTEDWTVYGNADLYFGSRLNLKISDNYVDGHEARSQSPNTTIERYRNNAANVSLTYVLADVSKVELDYTNAYWKYINSDFRSRDENQAALSLYYRILPRTSLFGEYDFKHVAFSDNPQALDNNVHSALLGLAWEFSERSKGTIKGGYLFKSFEQQAGHDFGTFTAALNVSHYFSDYNSVQLTGARTVNETSLSGTRYSVVTGINSEYTHRFLDRLASSLKFSYGEERFSDIVTGETQLRKDRVLQAGASLQYAFRRWLDCTLEYYWRNKDSNIDTFDSTENNISVRLKAFF